jgi:hypothetical protein
LEEERIKGKVHFLKAKLLIKVSSTVMGGYSQKKLLRSSYDHSYNKTGTLTEGRAKYQ